MQLAVGIRPLRRGALTMGTAAGGEDGEEEESPAARVGRLLRESPVVIFARRGCYMAHVMRRLLAVVGAHATVIEMDAAAAGAEEEVDEEELVVAAARGGGGSGFPVLFVGGVPVGGLEGLMGLHLSGRLVPRLREVGALCA